MDRFSESALEASQIKDINVLKQHIVFCLDTSISTMGAPIESEIEGVNRFADRTCESKAARRSVDVTVCGFSSDAWVIQDTCPVAEMLPVELEASGATDINCAVRLGVDKIKERHEAYRRAGAMENKASLVLITDGDDTITGNVKAACEAVQEIKGLAKLYILKIGAYDSNSNIIDLCVAAGGWGFELPLSEIDNIYDFFDLISDSAVAVSESEPGDAISIDTPIGPEGHSDSAVVAKSFSDWLTS